MSSIASSAAMGRAERQFREAFERLKIEKPRLLPKGTKVSQNNVAREAGVDPSALRKSRFPNLVAEIQQWLDEHVGNPPSDGGTATRQRHKRELKGKLEVMRLQRDDALAKLVDAEAHIIQLTIENQRLHVLLPASNLRPIRPAAAGRKKLEP